MFGVPRYHLLEHLNCLFYFTLRLEYQSELILWFHTRRIQFQTLLELSLGLLLVTMLSGERDPQSETTTEIIRTLLPIALQSALQIGRASCRERV